MNEKIRTAKTKSGKIVILDTVTEVFENTEFGVSDRIVGWESYVFNGKFAVKVFVPVS